MRIMSWNCRGLGGPCTVPQQESMRLFRPNLAFVCETKRKEGYVRTVCRKLGWGERWRAVDPVGRSGGLLVGWSRNTMVHQIKCSTFCLEVEFETSETNGKIWAAFVYASNCERVRKDQWQELKDRMNCWGDRWVLGGDFNEIRKPHEKIGGRLRTEASCRDFNDFVGSMNMEEIVFRGRQGTWANNWQED